MIYLGGNEDNWTLALGLNSLRGMEGERTTHYMMAFSVLMIMPMIAAFALGQNYMIRGVTFSGIKG